jgi:hypothetical protein
LLLKLRYYPCNALLTFFTVINEEKNIVLPYLVSYSMYVLGIQNNVAGGKGLILFYFIFRTFLFLYVRDHWLSEGCIYAAMLLYTIAVVCFLWFVLKFLFVRGDSICQHLNMHNDTSMASLR